MLLLLMGAAYIVMDVKTPVFNALAQGVFRYRPAPCTRNSTDCAVGNIDVCDFTADRFPPLDHYWNSYRLSDGFNWYAGTGGDDYCKKYPDTVLCHYQMMTGHGSPSRGDIPEEDRLTIMMDIMDNNFDLACEEYAATIFLRLGDGLCEPHSDHHSCHTTDVSNMCYRKLDCWNYDSDCVHPHTKSKEYYESIADKLSLMLNTSSNPQVLIIASPFHWTRSHDYRNGDYSVDSCYCNHVAGFLMDLGFDPVLRSPVRSPDEDLCVMSRSRIYIQGGGGFSRLAAKMVKRRGGTVIRP